VLCKHEVVGSIPSGSTRWNSKIDTMPAARRLETSSAKHHFASVVFTDCACGISDIVKRRLIRVLDMQSNLRNPIHNLQVISALAHRNSSQDERDERVVNDLFGEA
jgi:hypothetical protein